MKFTIAVVTGLFFLTACGRMGSSRAGSGPTFESSSSLTGPSLRYPAPKLSQPIVIELGTGDTQLNLDDDKDYVIKLPAQKKIGGTTITGGRNVVMIGGHVTIPTSATGLGGVYQRAVYIKDTRGTFHLEGVLIDASGGGESDAIAISAPDAIVQIQNVRVDGLLGKNSTWHADIIQPWGGVKELRVHNLTGSSHYQGLQIPIDKGPIGRATLSNVNLSSLGPQTKDSGGQLIWLAHGCADYPVTMTNVYVSNRVDKGFGQSAYPQSDDGTCPFRVDASADGAASGTWPSLKVLGRVTRGRPATGDFVPTGVAGLKYRSPPI